ncbi:GPI ethanolamine phosphate transferase 1 C-terminal, partial [Trinorchestia longiramus]
LFFVVLAFFGIGNLASVNSFDPSFVYCFVTVFSPLVMGGLLLLKILLPFLLVSCFFHAVCVLLQVPIAAMFQLFLVLSDIMALQFFLVIRTEGSWLAIGTSLSHFVISMASTVFLYVLMLLARLLNTVSLLPEKRRSAGQKWTQPVLPQTNRGRPHRD